MGRLAGVLLALAVASPASAQEPEPKKKDALAFNWPLPARLRVTETRTKDGETVATRMVISVAAEGEGLRLKHEQLELIDTHETVPATPEEKEEEAKLLAAMGPLPDFKMNRDGTGGEVVGLEEAIERWTAALSALDTDGLITEEARKRVRSPEVQSILKNKLVERWHIWVGAWMNIRLGPGQRIEHMREIPLGKTLVDAPSVLEHLGVVGPRTVRLRLTTRLEGDAARDAFQKMMRSVLGEGASVPQVIEFRRTTAVEVEINVDTGLPRAASTETLSLLHLAGEERRERVETVRYALELIGDEAAPR